jgi:hypothetical protein
MPYRFVHHRLEKDEPLGQALVHAANQKPCGDDQMMDRRPPSYA